MNPYLARLKILLAEKRTGEAPPKLTNRTSVGSVGDDERGFLSTWQAQETPNGVPFLHYCEVCGAWGAFGYGVKLRVGRLGRWFCFQHRPPDRTMQQAANDNTHRAVEGAS
jgi:hypothetical protein